MPLPPAEEKVVSPATIILKGRCPRCGTGKLYSGVLSMNDTCAQCGLAFNAREQGDGPAFFGILIVGALAAIGAAVTEIKYEPPFWLHAVIWLPFVILGSIASLRWLKALLMLVQYQIKPEDFTKGE